MKKKYPKISIIIPLFAIEERFYSDIKRFADLNYPNYEIIVVCDKKVKLNEPKVKLLLTHKRLTGPAEKRDLGIKESKGALCAFIDDDAYPDVNWLANAVKSFSNKQIAAVGGPGITPEEDSFLSQLTGLVYSSPLCGGLARYRFVKEKKRFVVDFPAYNLIVRKDVLKEIGGYGNHFYGGEDTFLCLKIIKNKWKILYDPEVVVYHHRRPLFISYLKQIANIGKHRGYFVKKFPETSRKPFYFVPSILTVGFSGGLFSSLFNQTIREVFLWILLMSLFVGAFSVRKQTSLLRGVVVSIGIILTHLTYGVMFIRGLLTRNLLR